MFPAVSREISEVTGITDRVPSQPTKLDDVAQIRDNKTILITVVNF